MTSLQYWIIEAMLLLAVPGTLSAGTVIYVDARAGDVNDGTTWKSAYRYLQDALAEAQVAQKPVEIRVAQGVYTPNRGTYVAVGESRRTRGTEGYAALPAVPDSQRSFHLINGVTIKGGFAGSAQPDPNIRDVERFQSILSGDLSGNDADVNSPEELLTAFGRAENSWHVVIGSNTDDSAVLDGFTITGGHWALLTDPPGGPTGGSGMYVEAGSPTIIDCTFTRNVGITGSGAMRNRKGSNPMLIRCAFIGNCSQIGGAGMSNSESNPHLVDCSFIGNFGGAMFNGVSSPLLENCTFQRNMDREYGAVLNRGSSPRFLNCLFSENTAPVAGAMGEDGSTTVLTACTFHHNSAGACGAITITGQSCCTLINCTFRANTSSSAGAIRLWFDNPALLAENCLFVGNRVLNAYALEGGGAALLYSGTAVFTNCTFAGNKTRTGGTFRPSFDAGLELYNCILWDPNAVAHFPYLGKVTVQYSAVWGALPGEGNIEHDPLFAQPGYWADPNDPTVPGNPSDPNAIWIDGDYHLKSQAGRWDPNSQSWVIDDVTSPCIDGGDPNTPVGDEPEPNGDRINMGCYGGTAEASKSYSAQSPAQTIVGDMNGDGRVDFQDMALLARHWMENSQQKPTTSPSP